LLLARDLQPARGPVRVGQRVAVPITRGGIQS
jgi:hypothetical protein